MCTKKSFSKNFSYFSDNGREQTEIDEDVVNLKLLLRDSKNVNSQ